MVGATVVARTKQPSGHVHHFVFPDSGGDDYVVGVCYCGWVSQPHLNRWPGLQIAYDMATSEERSVRAKKARDAKKAKRSNQELVVEEIPDEAESQTAAISQ